MPSKIWLQEHLDAAFELLIDGNSALAAAALVNTRFGTNYTRNAIIGQVHRHGTETVRGVMRSRTGKSRATRANHIVKKVVRTRPTVKPESKLAAFLRENSSPLPSPAETDVARISFDSMDHRKHCRFVPGDPADGFRLDKPMYCGLQPVPGTAYCPSHLQRCTDAPRTVVSMNAYKARVYMADTDKVFA